METAVQTLHHLSPFAAGFLVASIWQGVLLTASLALCLRVFRDVGPAVRMVLWTTVLVLVVALPGVSLLTPHSVSGVSSGLHVGQDWSFALMGVWLLVSVVRGVRLGFNAVRVQRLAGRAVPVTASGEVQALLAGTRPATLCVSGEVDRPSVAGLVRPRILLSPGLLETLSAIELEHVVLHEMEHLRRWDDWLNLLQQISLLLMPLNPALLWLDHRLCRDRELACDDGVLRTTHARRAYAACLVKLAEDSLLRKGVALALSALGTKSRESELVGRVRRILAEPETDGGSARGRFAVGTLMCAVLLLAGLLARSPRMVEFDPAAEVMAQSVPQSPPLQVQPGQGTMVPVRALEGVNAPRPVLTRAVVRPDGRPRAPRRVAALAVLRRRPLVRAVAFKAERPDGRSRQPWVSASPETLTSELVWSRPASQRAPGRVVVTEYEVSQPVYAAVPWRGGWLIVQL